MEQAFWVIEVPAGRDDGVEDLIKRGVPTEIAVGRTGGRWRGDEHHVRVVVVAAHRDQAIHRLRDAGVGGHLSRVHQVKEAEAKRVAGEVLEARSSAGPDARRIFLRCEELAAEVLSAARET